MKNTISILGCGWLGLPLAVDLIENGYEVRGSTTSPERLDELRAKGVVPHLIDIRESELEIQDFLKSDVLVIAITSKSLEDIRRLIVQIEKSGIEKVLFISSTSVYPNTNGRVTEETPTLDTPLAAIEKMFLSNASFQTTVLRFGGLIGYNRQPGNFVSSAKRISNPEGYVNLIHRDDCIQIIRAIIQQNVWNEVFNACSDDHPKRREFYTREAAKLGKHNLQFDENASNEYKIVDSEKLKERLGR